MIYLLEDDESIRNYVVYALNNTELETVGFGLPSEFRKALEKEVPSLVLLDIMLPEEDGLSVLKSLRASSATRNVPVIMLSAKGTEYDKVIGLDMGADDYIAKPFGIMELISRIKALLRRTSHVTNNLTVANITLTPDTHTVTVDNSEVILTIKEYELLALLMKEPGTVFTRNRILNEIWSFDFDGESRTVDVHIRTLRMKLGTAGNLIETVRGVGYKITEGKL